MKSLPGFILSQTDAVHALCLKHGVRKLSLFGSVLTDRFDPAHSDLDFLVDFLDPEAPSVASRYLDLAEDHETLFQRPVDLITKPAVRSPIFKEQLNATSHSLYAAWGHEVIAGCSGAADAALPRVIDY
jgi:predicted nucleotidyltransferase